MFLSVCQRCGTLHDDGSFGLCLSCIDYLYTHDIPIDDYLERRVEENAQTEKNNN